MKQAIYNDELQNKQYDEEQNSKYIDFDYWYNKENI